MRIFTALCKQMIESLDKIDLKSLVGRLRDIDEQASIMLHHDAITATSPTSTLSDYMRRVRQVDSLVSDEVK